MKRRPLALERFQLSGRGVGVTGGGGHLGRAMALGLAEAGAIVVICGRDLERLRAVEVEAEDRALPGRVIAVRADINNTSEMSAVMDRVERESGGIWGWVNNAYSGAGGSLLGATDEQLDQTISSGLTTVLQLTREVAKRMVGAGGGSIVNISSMYGMVSPQPEAYRDHPHFHNPPAYGAAKAGILQYTRYAACHLAPNIRVNAISPGPFPGEVPSRDPSFIDALARRVPLGRVGAPEEIAGAVLFLISDASSFVTGHNLVVDGGWTAW